MKQSTLTLQNLKDKIPLQLTGRYSLEEFPVAKFNEISSHLEKYCDTQFLTNEMIIPMVDGVSDYVLSDLVRQPRGLYIIPLGGVLDANGQVVTANSVSHTPASISPDKSTPIRIRLLGNRMRIDAVPSVSEPIHTDARTIVSSTGSTISKLYDVDATGPLSVDENLRGKAIVITHATGEVDHLIIANNDSTGNYVRVNGEMSVIPDNSTIYSIYNDFWILEYVIYMPKLAALSDTIGVPTDFESVFQWGMYWKYYAQEGENKIEI